MQQLARRRQAGAAPAPAPALAGAALAVVLLAALLPGAADAAPAWLFPLLPHGGGKPLVIEGVACPAAVVDVPTSAAFPPAPWAASATYRLTTAGAEYVLPNGGGPLVIGVNVTVCVVGTRATLRAANNVAYFDLEGGALGLSGVTLRGNGTGPNGVRTIKGGTQSTLGAADVSFEQLYVSASFIERATAAFRDARFVGNAGGGVRAGSASTLVFRGDTLFANNVRATRSFYAGAALYADEETSVVFEGPARFSNNSVRVDTAGVALTIGQASVRFLSDAVFEDNFVRADATAPRMGAIGTVDLVLANATFQGRLTRFARNSVGVDRFGYGAGVNAVYSQVVFASDVTEFVDQEAYLGAGVNAGASSVTFTRGAVRATGCRAARGGSFLYVEDSTASFSPETTLDVDGNQAPYGQLVVRGSTGGLNTGGSRVDVHSRTVRFANNFASVRGGALSVETNSSLMFGPATRVTLAGNVAGDFGGAIFALVNATVAFEGGACIKNNSAQYSLGGGALYARANSSIVFKDPPAAAAGGCGFLPHPFLAAKLCPAAPQQQVMGDNYPAAALVSDNTSAIVCASNGLTRGEGLWAIEGPVCGQACVAGGGNCSCPAGQPFSAAECACKAPKPAWPFPHPWPFGTKVSAASSSVASSTNLGKSVAPSGNTKPAAMAAPPARTAITPLPLPVPLEAADLARLKRTKAAARP